ncbi:LPXTG cell wall anchor domain-containing protein [Mammaliicoccus sciuri]|uniref:LPXTG cell wall anchor domain-containing protein n=1 Tax=Mammaliicoccus sciuri TaxID=1296 RepID=A0AB37HKF6_MAMSC|nr:LPXTG cell wall anchor domain-containing protein [Mammaliicoccus sciuri]MCD8835847.1 LPXTG cell wall anchor domain-containing protein [Mammaliicoccus sciuri]MCJ0939201.1 LPXTG cell wall anchor domain-containing protein [Mammaliicoccus sciuri]MCJ0964347.1 LPXTG cell wall anchor domain-containing protein [Mammaliicoccus sciuri]MEB6226447.1 LPXTG cell wall anchor domain-containing protein [Mammaliicoccus sciuri]QRN90339.1 LPXTG cell wall anchor domain-containing protein [Mammaliicoccus sciuri]
MLKKILLSTLLCTTITTPLIGKVNAEEMKQDKPVKYVFKSGGKASPIYINSDGSMTIPEKELLEVYIERPSDYYVVKDGVKTYEVTPKYKHIKNQWAYYDFYASKGRTADLFVGEHPRPLDGEIFVPKYDNTSDNTKVDDKIDNQNNVNDKNNDQKDESKNDQTEPNKNAIDNQSMTEQPKQNVPAKVEQPAKDNAKVDKKSDSQSNVVDMKDTADQNKVVSNNKAVADNQKSEPQSSDTSKKVDGQKEDNNKDVKATDNKAKTADNKSDKQQKELPKTGESDSTWLRNGLVILSALIFLGIYRLSRKYEV